MNSDSIKRLLGGKRGELRSFHAVREQEQARDCIERGTSMVPISKIVGTVGRYNDFDGRFRPKRQGDSPRLLGIMQAMREGKGLPSVSL
ncbi:MAG TPA: hypothetical protein ENK89_01140, partial [Desulfobulbaceae bacterium]|nr:hypothetical protein [Desulfobulbaceae bacterium]